MNTTVVTLDEIAEALQKDRDEVMSMMSAFHALGFPKPVQDESYLLSHVLDWLVAQQEMNLALVTMLSQKIG
ncbi:MAG: hypothetical protein JNM45_17110 [Rhizobiales bacterium]|nr:hypothetical protein [Hyphomicrobiales bacterium]